LGEGDNVSLDFLVIGHATRDLLPAGGWRLGGTVTFAALTAQRLGMGRVGVVTSGTADVLAALGAALPGVEITAVPSDMATTYENLYTPGGRRQYLRGRAAALGPDDVPTAWQSAGVVLLAPLADEVDPALAGLCARAGALVGATPQGWLRRFGADGRVTAGSLEPEVEERLLPHVEALVLSAEDLLVGDAETEAIAAQMAPWAERVPYVVVTLGEAGALLFERGRPAERVAGYTAAEVDLTGAGDVFAAAFLCELRATGLARAAANFANCVAALSVEGVGATSIPTRADVAARFG
jgi:sugar/nucleoside kinase (ribokinase family)